MSGLSSRFGRGAALLLIGVETWLLAVVLPRLRVGLTAPDASGWGAIFEVALCVAPLAFLAVGLAGGVGYRGRRLALVVAYPLSLASALAARPDFAEHEAFGPILVALASVSLAAFVILSVGTAAVPERLRQSAAQGLPAEVWNRVSRSHRVAHAVVGLVGLSALFALVLAFWGGRADVVVRFGQAGDDAIVLSVVLASLAFAIALAAIVGPALRARKRTDVGRERLAPRTLPYLVLALLALALRGALYVLDAR